MPFNGFLPVDKPSGCTSHDVVARVRQKLKIRKVGHTGTLDPMATGVLVLCLGAATRLSGFLTDLDKTYQARIHLGVCTDTLDADGTVVSRSEHVPTEKEIVTRALGSFEGQIQQIPPMYSARKIRGQRLYKLARSGEEVPREARPVSIYRIAVDSFVPPLLDLTLDCGKGTYIRVLADDLGKKLGCGAHLEGLRRTRASGVGVDRCISLEFLEEMTSAAAAEPYLVGHDLVLAHLSKHELSGPDKQKFQNGNAVHGVEGCEDLPGGLLRVVCTEGALLGIGQWDANQKVLQPVRVFTQPVI